MSDDRLKIEDAAKVTCPWTARPIAADARVLRPNRVAPDQVTGCRARFAAAIDHFEKAIAARDVPLPAQRIA